MTTKKPSGRSHGFRHKSRSIMTKTAPRGVSFLLREYHEGDRALVIIDPDSEPKKKTTKMTKSKTEPEIKEESKTDSVDVDAKIEDIPEDSE